MSHDNERHDRNITCLHHCYHTVPGVYGDSGGRGDTYDEERCCKCGATKPNPYANERR